MRTFTREELMMNQEAVLDRIRAGEVFIHPTDTIYGIGCNALHDDAVQKLRQLKNRFDTPLSVIVPGKDWIRENCEVTKDADEWISKLPGAYTLIFGLKNKNSISAKVNLGKDSLGVRIPNHWFQEIATILNIPIVTTSVNRTGKRYMTSLDDLDSEIKKGVHFVVYEGEKQGSASKLVHLNEDEIKVQER